MKAIIDDIKGKKQTVNNASSVKVEDIPELQGQDGDK